MKYQRASSFWMLLGFLCLSTTAYSQFTVSGTITDNEGTTVIGASILVQGTNSGTVTDFDGNYSLQVPRNQAVLVISYTGFATQEIEVTSQDPTVNIIMSPSAELLQEVVVTGYGETALNNFSGSAAKVDIDRVATVPRTNFQESLDGNVAGLQVAQGSGQPGAFQNVQIRGLGSINASATPLYVIDGVPVFTGNIGNESSTSTPLSGLNPQDIADIQVLKDASATSIYGSRAANGVIVITTKRGTSGRSSINANVQTGFSDVSLSDKLRPLNSDEYLELIREGLVNRGTAANLDEAQQIILDRGIDPDVNTDWFDAITRRGTFTNANLSASGGNDDLRYFLSGGYQQNEGTVIGTDFTRYSSRFNLNTDLADWFELNFNGSMSFTSQNTVGTGGQFANPVRSIFRLVPTLPIFNEDGSYNTGFNATYNPIGEVLENERTSDILNLLGSVGAVIDLPFIDGLTFEPFFSYNSIRGEDRTFFIPDFGSGASGNGVAEYDVDVRNNWLARNMLKYKARFDDLHGIDVTLGMEAQEFTRNFNQSTVSNFAFNNLRTQSNGSVFDNISGTQTVNSLVGYFLNANYNYDGLVYTNGTYRRDGSSRFGSDNRYANFYSVGVGVNLDRFAFLEENPIFNTLRLRASYGQNGNQAGIDNFASRGLYGSGDDYAGNPGILLDQLENPSLTWEVNEPLNFGIDVGIWNRLDLTVDLYSRNTSSLLFDQPVSPTNGVEEITTNIGELQNRGVELTLETRNVVSETDGFTWSTSFNFTRNVNEVIALPDGDFADGSRFREVGQPWNTWFFEGYAGVNPATGEPQWYLDETETEITTNYNEAGRYNQGTSDPDFFGGMRNTFTFKGLSLAVQLNYRYGAQILHSWHRFTHTDGAGGFNTTRNVARSVYERRWQNPGDVTDTPQFILNTNRRSQERSTRFLYDGTYISVRDVILSYSIPTGILQRTGFRNARIFAQASNLAIWTRDDRLERDPRTDASGVIDQEIPIPRTITFGLDLSF
jgi:TonB-linked SusC/RagA family outer membrane protein